MSKNIDRIILIKYILEMIKETDIFNQNDFNWIELTLNRTDGFETINYLKNLIQECNNYLETRKKEQLKPWDEYSWQQRIFEMLNACKSIYYRQKTVLLGVPQRKRFKEFLAPNLSGFIAPQSCRIDIDGCYSLGYCESRQFFVEKALSNPKYTHIMFVDDDISLPLNAVDTLLLANEIIVGASYVKKNPLLESTATQIVSDPKFIYTNSSVPCIQNDMKPVPVNAMGLGATLIDLDFFRNLPKPHFYFQFDEKGKVLVGEDSLLIQRALISNITPKIIPGLVAVHTDFQDGKQYGPEWLVDPISRTLRKEYLDYYCKFACDPKELYHKDIENVFNR